MRILKEIDPFNPDLCLPRWQRDYASRNTTLSRNYSLQYDVLPPHQRRMNQNQKYKKAREITSQIDKAMSAKPQQPFDVYEKFLKEVAVMITESRIDFDSLGQTRGKLHATVLLFVLFIYFLGVQRSIYIVFNI